MLYSVLTGKNRIPEWINSKQEENNVKTKEELNTFKEEVETMNRKPVSFLDISLPGVFACRRQFRRFVHVESDVSPNVGFLFSRDCKLTIVLHINIIKKIKDPINGIFFIDASKRII